MGYYDKGIWYCEGVKNIWKVPLEVKVLGIATYIQTSSVRAARILSEIHPVSKTSLEG